MSLGEPTGWTPQWQAQGVGAWMSHRQCGVSVAPYESLNLGVAVGDDPVAVRANRRLFQQALEGAEPVFLKQVHGVRVVRLGPADRPSACTGTTLHEADAAVTTEQGLACVVQVADCLPVLFAAPQGRAVGAAHAGWRGLAGGVLEATVTALCEVAACEPQSLCAWLGPCIGPRQFEVGEDVRAAFASAPPEAFSPGVQPGKFWADLPALARWRLALAGLSSACLAGGECCTVENRSRFFSFRRDGVTGRMAAAIWRRA